VHIVVFLGAAPGSESLLLCILLCFWVQRLAVNPWTARRLKVWAVLGVSV